MECYILTIRWAAASNLIVSIYNMKVRCNLSHRIRVKLNLISCTLKVLIGSRRQLVNNKQQIIGTIRGLLKIYGIKLGSKSKLKDFVNKIREEIKLIDEISRNSIEALISSLEALELSIVKLDKMPQYTT